MSTSAPLKRRPLPWHIVVFLAPAVVIYTLFMVYPLVDSLRLSLYATNDNHEEVFVGLDNYHQLFTDDIWRPRMEGALKHNIQFFLIHMFVQNPLGLLLASLLSSPFIRGRTIYRTLIFTPTVLSVVLVGFIWKIILNPVWGISADIIERINQFVIDPLNALDVFGLYHIGYIQNRPWLGLEDTALTTLSLISVWQWVGIPMMLFLASLISIPDELIEAARVDGATAWSVWRRIKLPLIMPTVGIVGILTFVGNFNAFDLIYTTQRAAAAPNYSTDILGTFFYRTFFGIQLTPGNPTMGATIAGVMFLIILAGVVLYMFGWQRRVVQIEF